MEPDKELLTLQTQLAETIAAERFFETDPGRLFEQVATRKIDSILKDITSDKYIKDHAGYVAALADLRAYRYMLRAMQVGGSKQRRRVIEEKLGQYESEQS